MTSGALARAAGVGLQTIRFYERKGLLQERTACRSRPGPTPCSSGSIIA